MEFKLDIFTKTVELTFSFSALLKSNLLESLACCWLILQVRQLVRLAKLQTTRLVYNHVIAIGSIGALS
jgi:hypothetical protein